MEIGTASNLRVLSTTSSRTAASRAVQAAWAGWSLGERLRTLAAIRHGIAANAAELARAAGGGAGRPAAEVLSSEVVPLADACRFLEREAPRLLATRRLGSHGRPAWLGGVEAEVRREPLGLVLVIAPSNYPLFLPGVQTLQALAAGNAVLLEAGAGRGRISSRLRRGRGRVRAAGGRALDPPRGPRGGAAGDRRRGGQGPAHRLQRDRPRGPRRARPQPGTGDDGALGVRRPVRPPGRRSRPGRPRHPFRADAERRRHLHCAPPRLRAARPGAGSEGEDHRSVRTPDDHSGIRHRRGARRGRPLPLRSRRLDLRARGGGGGAGGPGARRGGGDQRRDRAHGGPPPAVRRPRGERFRRHPRRRGAARADR